MIIKTYKDLEDYLKMFKKQNLDLLIIMSRGGLGKSTILKEVMGKDNFVFVNTHSTPLRTFLDLYEKMDECVVFDDIDSILRNQIFVSMLKSLADTSPIKEINYRTTSRLLGTTPQSFKTTSNVCILLNEFDVQSSTLAPLIDRAFMIEFKPSREEILKKIRQIIKSQNIDDMSECVYDFIEKHYQKIEKFSLRTYAKAMQLYNNNERKWEEQFMKMVGFDEKLIEYLKLQDLDLSENEKAEKYHWSRATYFRVAKEFE